MFVYLKPISVVQISSLIKEPDEHFMVVNETKAVKSQQSVDGWLA